MYAVYKRCTSLLRAPVSEMTYTVSSGTLNSTILYHLLECNVRLQFKFDTILGSAKVWLLVVKSLKARWITL